MYILSSVQIFVAALTTFMMFVNWLAFGSFARDAPYYEQLAKVSSLRMETVFLPAFDFYGFVSNT